MVTNTRYCHYRQLGHTVAYAAKDQPAHIKEVDGQFLVYRSADNKVLKSVKFSPPDLKDILGAENIPAKRTDHGR